MLLSPIKISPFVSRIASGSTVFTINNSFLLDGVNEYFTIDYSKLNPLITGSNLYLSFTIMFKRGNTGVDQYIFGNVANTVWRLRFDAVNNLILYCFNNSSSPKFAYPTYTFNDTNWNFFTINIDYNNPVATRTSFMLNGADLPLQSGNIDTILTTTSDFQLGKGNIAFNGYINNLTILNRPMLLAEHIDFYNNGKPKNPQNLFGSNCKYFWNPDNSGNTAQFTVTDSVNSINATSVNMEDSDKTTVTPY